MSKLDTTGKKNKREEKEQQIQKRQKDVNEWMNVNLGLKESVALTEYYRTPLLKECMSDFTNNEMKEWDWFQGMIIYSWLQCYTGESENSREMLKTPFKMPHESEQVLSLYFIPCFLQKRCFHVGEILLCPSPGVETKHCVCQKRCTQACVWLSFPNAELRGAGETRDCSSVPECRSAFVSVAHV